MCPQLLFLWVLLLMLAGCVNAPDAGPVEVQWEHAACHRCSMVLTDSFHAAQVRHHPAGEQSKVYLFDDIGCAIIWLEDKAWRDDPATEIWVNDYKTGAWLDARKAHYVGGQETPMLYGLGAQPQATEGSVGFERAKQHIFEIDRRLGQHGAH